MAPGLSPRDDPRPPDPDERREHVGLVAAGVSRSGGTLRDTRLVDADLANVHARRATVSRVEVVRGRLTGTDLLGATLRDVRVDGCRADLVGLDGATLERVRLEDCDLREATLSGARLHSVAFVDCDLRGADLTNILPSRVVMTGCRLDGLRGVPSLRGVRMAWTDVLDNAGLFASSLGVVVLDDD